MDYKEVNRRMYDACARRFEEVNKGKIKDTISWAIHLFMGMINGGRVLDLGCGPGRDSLYFQQRGLQPLCFDFSEDMLKLCREKGLETKLGDIERMHFLDNRFDGVWANASLLHVPKKKILRVLENIGKILVPKGIFYVGIKEGEGERYVESGSYPGEKRFFAFYQDGEFRKLLGEAGFVISQHRKNAAAEDVFLNYIARNGKS